MTAQIIDAAEALRIGLVSQVVEPDTLLETARALAKRIAAQPPLAVRHVKEGLRRGAGRSYSDLGDLATFVGNGLARLFDSEDHAEAVAAFLEKRPPSFTGR
jgi:enoyl-CoA hydratase/carnithine racemase